MKFTILCLFLMAISAIPAFAQDGSGGQNAIMKPVFKVGDMVVSPKSTNGKPGRIESINGNAAKVRYGSGKYEFFLELLDNLITPQAAATQREAERQDEEQKPLRAQFKAETQQFDTLVANLVHAYNAKYSQREITMEDKPAIFEQWNKDLEVLAAVCKKYPNMTNAAYTSEPPYDTDFRNHPADWCKLAEQRAAVIMKTRLTGYDHYAAIEINSLVIGVTRTIENAAGYVDDEMQMMLYDRAAWETKYLGATKKRYTSAGVKMPLEILKPLDEKSAALKAQIDRDAPTRSWTPLKLSDPALEALARKDIVADFPGAKVFKTGMTYASWEARDHKTYVGSDSNFRYYRITPGAYRFRRGLALIQMPNRPFCQIREFQVTQYKAGGGYGPSKAGVASTGIFVKCP